MANLRILLSFLGDGGCRRTVLRARVQAVAGMMHFMLRPSRIWGMTYGSYLPDSIAVTALHPEMREFVRRWAQSNRRRNLGDLGRLFALVLNIKRVLRDNVQGDFAELGVFKGNSAAVLAALARPAGRKLLLFDTFTGFDPRDLVGVDNTESNRGSFSETSIEGVRAMIGDDRECIYFRGYFPESITDDARARQYAFVHLDCDLYLPTKAALEFFYPRLSPGAMILVHDYSSGHWPGVTNALDEFCGATGETVVLLPDKSGTAVLRKRRQTATPPEKR